MVIAVRSTLIDIAVNEERILNSKNSEVKCYFFFLHFVTPIFFYSYRTRQQTGTFTFMDDSTIWELLLFIYFCIICMSVRIWFHHFDKNGGFVRVLCLLCIFAFWVPNFCSVSACNFNHKILNHFELVLFWFQNEALRHLFVAAHILLYYKFLHVTRKKLHKSNYF